VASRRSGLEGVVDGPASRLFGPKERPSAALSSAGIICSRTCLDARHACLQRERGGGGAGCRVGESEGVMEAAGDEDGRSEDRVCGGLAMIFKYGCGEMGAGERRGRRRALCPRSARLQRICVLAALADQLEISRRLPTAVPHSIPNMLAADRSR
jgi:hypothetical protein